MSSKGKVFSFTTDNKWLNNGAIRDYEWSYDSTFNKVRAFNIELKTAQITLYFTKRKRRINDLQDTAEQFYRIIDEDCRRMQMGKLYYNDYYINCYIIGTQKKHYDSGVVIGETATVLSDFIWRKDVKQVFGRDAVIITDSGLDYPYDYDYDYAPDYDSRRFVTKAIAPFDFTIEWSGYELNPQVTVNGHIYRVYVELFEGQNLAIDSVNKTIIRTLADGTKVNEFDNRDRNNYIFEKMEVVDGSSIVELDGSLSKCVITAHIERSEPTWI
jgi:hypothetical protein